MWAPLGNSLGEVQGLKQTSRLPEAKDSSQQAYLLPHAFKLITADEADARVLWQQDTARVRVPYKPLILGPCSPPLAIQRPPPQVSELVHEAVCRYHEVLQSRSPSVMTWILVYQQRSRHPNSDYLSRHRPACSLREPMFPVLLMRRPRQKY